MERDVMGVLVLILGFGVALPMAIVLVGRWNNKRRGWATEDERLAQIEAAYWKSRESEPRVPNGDVR